MTTVERREALRGAEVQTFDLFAQVLTSEEWAELLNAPLERAVVNGDRALAQKLVEAGAEIGNALHAAAEDGHKEIVNDLLRNGASVAARYTAGYTPLHRAAHCGKTEMVQLLLLQGAEKDAWDDDGEHTPLSLAADGGHVAAALALLAAGADVRSQYDHKRQSIVHKVLRCGGNVDILRAVIERGADVRAADALFDAPLHVAAYYGRVEAIHILVEAGADIETRDEYTSTPLHVAASRINPEQDRLRYAAMQRMPEVIDALVEAGANVEARDDEGSTPLHFAAGSGRLEVVSTLLKHGANVNARDGQQDTPLHRAVTFLTYFGRRGTAEVVDSLLRSGADETILNAHGRAPADVVAPKDEEQEQDLAEDLHRVRELLANAPAERAWRRRGYLVLCRAHPDRMQNVHESSTAHAGVAPGARSGGKLGSTATRSCTGTTGGSMVDGRTDGDWTVVVAKVLGLQEEGIFRTIVGYL